jgi:Rrf2 family protein
MWYGLRPQGDNVLKISRLTDYGLQAAAYVAQNAGRVVPSREVAEFFSLPMPVISKVLKLLHEGGVIRSHRGVDGGYSFEGDLDSVTLGHLLEVLEGPWDLVECESLNEDGHAVCSIRHGCPSRTFMFGISRAIKDAFQQVTLGDLTRAAFAGDKVWSEPRFQFRSTKDIQ